MPIAEVREALSKHVKSGLFITGRSPLKGEPFDDQWDHLQSVLSYKAVKDMLIKEYMMVHGIDSEASKTIDLMTVKHLFFDSYPPVSDSLLPQQVPVAEQSRVLVNINTMTINMQMYVLG